MAATLIIIIINIVSSRHVIISCQNDQLKESYWKANGSSEYHTPILIIQPPDKTRQDESSSRQNFPRKKVEEDY